MQREIKFRAWNSDDKSMMYMDETESDQLPNELLSVFLDDNYGCELLQYTGLKDNNGKEVYEGDIVKRYHTQGIVAWHKERAMFIVNDGFNEPLYQDILGVEIIGNIYEDENLWEQKSGN